MFNVLENLELWTWTRNLIIDKILRAYLKRFGDPEKIGEGRLDPAVNVAVDWVVADFCLFCQPVAGLLFLVEDLLDPV